MILNSKVLGSSKKKIIILHGFLGSLDNWITFSKKISENNFEVHLIDQRNHGKSFHSNEFNYKLMVQDLYEYISEYNINIKGQYLKTNEEIGYVITDIDSVYNKEVVKSLKDIPATIKLRVLY